jgi:hypothetical protein
MTATAEAREWTGGRPLREAYGDLLWRRPSVFGRDLILEAGSELLASLHWEKWYSFEALGRSADGGWTLTRHRGGSLLGGCVVRDAASGAEVASFKRSWRGTGTARFASGAEYAWQREGFWRPRYFWTGPDGRPLVWFKGLLGLGKSYEMTVDPAARERAEFPVLVLLGSYVMAVVSAQKHSN